MYAKLLAILDLITVQHNLEAIGNTHHLASGFSNEEGNNTLSIYILSLKSYHFIFVPCRVPHRT